MGTRELQPIPQYVGRVDEDVGALLDVHVVERAGNVLRVARAADRAAARGNRVVRVVR
jgi:hypothetical protein